ncbi:MAG TPA: IS110 family transposase [Acholeplasma sp.]|nr:IS110 family transposase [Acholeplasma sp.]
MLKVYNDTPYKILKSIPGIGPVYAAGLLAEIGEIDQFPNDAALAKYAGLTWRKRESGNYVAQQTKMTKTGNMYLRYFLIQSANLIRQNNAEYNLYFNKKFKEVKKYQFKRALVLTARKLVRLIHSLLRDNRLFQE